MAKNELYEILTELVEILPTMDEVHKEWVNSFHASA